MKKLYTMLAVSSLFCFVAFADGEKEASALSKSSERESLSTGVVSPVQVKVQPAGLQTVAPVMQAGSDKSSATFQKEILQDVTKMLNVRLNETVAFKDASAMRLDPSKLVLQNQSDARVYFAGEGAGYHNTIGFNTWQVGQNAPKGAVGDNAKLIFPDASSSVSTYDPSSNIARTSSNPLLPGDFVNLGSYKANTVLDFFLISNGAAGGSNKFTADPARNSDGLNHVVSFALADSPFLIIAFEDMLNGGDRDYNDAIIVLDIGRANVANLTVAPEPALWAIMAGFLGIALWMARPRQQRV